MIASRFLVTCVIGVALATSSIASAQTYTGIDYPGAITTTLNGGPNPQGTSVGSWSDGTNTHGFTLSAKGAFTSFDPPGSISTAPNFITPEGVIVGSYNDVSNVSHGFVLKGSRYTTVDYPGAAGAGLVGLNPSGELSGFTCAVPSCVIMHSFTVSKRGVFSAMFDPPGAISSVAFAIPSGAIVGYYQDSGATYHGYRLDHGRYTTIDYPGAALTFGLGANPEGDMVGEYFDSAFAAHSFLLSDGAFTSFDYPGATFSGATGINPGGIIVGIYFDSANVEHAYIRTP